MNGLVSIIDIRPQVVYFRPIVYNSVLVEMKEVIYA